MPRLVLATRNPHKVREIERLLTGSGIEIHALPQSVELPPEDGDTFADNALPKARAAAQATGMAAIADDSGIEAEALGGGPGVRSARYAGVGASDEENLKKLMAEVPAGTRLQYVCALAYVDPQAGLECVFFGDCRGRMAEHARGSRGFGYDPVFAPEADPRFDGNEVSGLRIEERAWLRTMAELSDEEKDRISHRGRAMRAFMQWLET